MTVTPVPPAPPTTTTTSPCFHYNGFKYSCLQSSGCSYCGDSSTCMPYDTCFYSCPGYCETNAPATTESPTAYSETECWDPEYSFVRGGWFVGSILVSLAHFFLMLAVTIWGKLNLMRVEIAVKRLNNEPTQALMNTWAWLSARTAKYRLLLALMTTIFSIALLAASCSTMQNGHTPACGRSNKTQCEVKSVLTKAEQNGPGTHTTYNYETGSSSTQGLDVSGADGGLGGISVFLLIVYAVVIVYCDFCQYLFDISRCHMFPWLETPLDEDAGTVDKIKDVLEKSQSKIRLSILLFVIKATSCASVLALSTVDNSAVSTIHNGTQITGCYHSSSLEDQLGNSITAFIFTLMPIYLPLIVYIYSMMATKCGGGGVASWLCEKCCADGNDNEMCGVKMTKKAWAIRAFKAGFIIYACYGIYLEIYSAAQEAKANAFMSSLTHASMSSMMPAINRLWRHSCEVGTHIFDCILQIPHDLTVVADKVADKVTLAADHVANAAEHAAHSAEQALHGHGSSSGGGSSQHAAHAEQAAETKCKFLIEYVLSDPSVISSAETPVFAIVEKIIDKFPGADALGIKKEQEKVALKLQANLSSRSVNSSSPMTNVRDMVVDDDGSATSLSPRGSDLGAPLNQQSNLSNYSGISQQQQQQQQQHPQYTSPVVAPHPQDMTIAAATYVAVAPQQQQQQVMQQQPVVVMPQTYVPVVPIQQQPMIYQQPVPYVPLQPAPYPPLQQQQQPRMQYPPLQPQPQMAYPPIIQQQQPIPYPPLQQQQQQFAYPPIQTLQQQQPQTQQDVVVVITSSPSTSFTAVSEQTPLPPSPSTATTTTTAQEETQPQQETEQPTSNTTVDDPPTDHAV
jgi:hypothetical protein